MWGTSLGGVSSQRLSHQHAHFAGARGFAVCLPSDIGDRQQPQGKPAQHGYQGYRYKIKRNHCNQKHAENCRNSEPNPKAHNHGREKQKQNDAGKALSEKQIAALGKMIEKYQDQLPEAQTYLAVIREKLPVVAEDPASAEKAQLAEELIKGFDKVTKWAEPVQKGRRVYNDQEFVKSIANHLKAGKTLSDKQMEALKKMAAKYSV